MSLGFVQLCFVICCFFPIYFLCSRVLPSPSICLLFLESNWKTMKLTKIWHKSYWVSLSLRYAFDKKIVIINKMPNSAQMKMFNVFQTEELEDNTLN